MNCALGSMFLRSVVTLMLVVLTVNVSATLRTNYSPYKGRRKKLHI